MATKTEPDYLVFFSFSCDDVDVMCETSKTIILVHQVIQIQFVAGAINAV